MTTRHAIVYHGLGQKAWEEVSDPVIIDDTDAIVRVDVWGPVAVAPPSVVQRESPARYHSASAEESTERSEGFGSVAH